MGFLKLVGIYKISYNILKKIYNKLIFKYVTT